jgi:dATP pyrophosphohydrolase
VTGSLDREDEPLAETCRREVFEETGIDVAAHELTDWHLENHFEIFPHWRHRYPEGVTRNTEHVFALSLPDTQPVRLAPREHLDYVWLAWEEAAERCFSWSNAAAIRLLPLRVHAR